MAGGEVLVTGAEGGREIALVQALQASPEVSRVELVANVAEGLSMFSGPEKPLVVIGPEGPAVAGVADELRAEGYPVFGAGKRAARYEASKSFAARMMVEQGIPHPETFTSHDPDDDEVFVLARDPNGYVIKADGLAGGKGVVLPENRAEAMRTVRALRAGEYDKAGKEIINFSDRHSGPEISVMAVVGDNDEHVLLPFAQDHKRLRDGDEGPNTGGMGAYAPVPESIVSPEQNELLHELAAVSLAGMREHGVPFERGVLYIGTMLSEQQGGRPVVIEYNVRCGDPETQVQMPWLTAFGVDTYRLLYSAAVGELEVPRELDRPNLALSALTVCLAAPGYPQNPQKGGWVYGLDGVYPGVTIQPAGITADRVSGGRAVYVTATGRTLQQARVRAYDAIDTGRAGPDSGRVGFPDMQFRTDIGHRALQAVTNS